MIPFILGAAALGTAAYGFLKGSEGAVGIMHAQERAETAQVLYKQALDHLNTERSWTSEVIKEYGDLQLQIASTTVSRFVDVIKNAEFEASQGKPEFLESLEISAQQMQKCEEIVVEAADMLKGILMAGTTAGFAYSGAFGLATSVGVASTGTAISGLSGAAATNATLAWLGGGALSAGGGGMALGALVLGGITVGPALAVGGFVLADQGEKALTEACLYEAKVMMAIGEIKHVLVVLQRIKKRIFKISSLLKKLDSYSQKLLNELESCPVHSQQDAGKLRQAALLTEALMDIMSVPVLLGNGGLNPATEGVLAKYESGMADLVDLEVREQA